MSRTFVPKEMTHNCVMLSDVVSSLSLDVLDVFDVSCGSSLLGCLLFPCQCPMHKQGKRSSITPSSSSFDVMFPSCGNFRQAWRLGVSVPGLLGPGGRGRLVGLEHGWNGVVCLPSSPI